MKKQLSTGAQKVLDASRIMSGSPPPQRHRESIAAAIRAVVEHVLPADDPYERIHERVIANEFLDIVAELESIND